MNLQTERLPQIMDTKSNLSDTEITISESRIIDFGSIGSDELGFLTVAQANKNIPFDIKRVYWTYFTPELTTRGHHAHKKLKQIIFAIAGELEVELETPDRKKLLYKLSSPNTGLYIPELHWRTLTFSKNTVLLSLASLDYDEQEYIRNYEEFAKLCLHITQNV